jgi:hypothetical protein
MSWSDIFPLMDDDLVESYLERPVNQESEVAYLFSVHSVYNRNPASHVVSTSLFWKPAFATDPDFPTVTREIMKDPTKAGLQSRFKNPWAHYFLPILSGSKSLRRKRPDIAFRVYLAQDFKFLIPELVEAGCKVFLMDSSSIRHNPGAMWRFLAMEEECLVTITDSDRARNVIHDVERTEQIAKSQLNYWRTAYFIGVDNDDVGSPGTYRTMLACQFGSSAPLPMRLLCEAFVWNFNRGTIPKVCTLGNLSIPIFGSDWPTYGFDEFFLNTAVFPRIANGGVVTFVPWNGSAVGTQALNHWFALDIEYCNWANPNSEIIFFGDQPKRLSDLEKANCKTGKMLGGITPLSPP